MEYMEVSLDSLDLRVKGILSSPAGGEWQPAGRARPGPGPGAGALFRRAQPGRRAGARLPPGGCGGRPARRREPRRRGRGRGRGWGARLGWRAVAREDAQRGVRGAGPARSAAPLRSLKDADVASPQTAATAPQDPLVQPREEGGPVVVPGCSPPAAVPSAELASDPVSPG